jgi:TetR/AcrR family transcriptional regulator, transcriptional repressor for nem operon
MILRTLRNDRLRCLSACAPSSMRGSSISVGSVWRNGCLIGDFSAEASAHSEVIRKRLVEIYEEMRQSVAYCLRAAVKIGEVPRKTECDELAGFLIASLQGAILQSKRSVKPYFPNVSNI